MVAFSREPEHSEMQAALDYLDDEIKDAAGKPVAAGSASFINFQDLIWALMNTKEFIFNH